MSKTLPPTALYDAGLYYADRQLTDRKAELKSMRSSLQLLDQYMPELRARHIAPAVSFIHWRAVKRSLALSTVFSSDSVKLHQALIELGFAETGRQDHGSFFLVDLKKGRLKLHVAVYPSKAAA